MKDTDSEEEIREAVCSLLSNPIGSVVDMEVTSSKFLTAITTALSQRPSFVT